LAPRQFLHRHVVEIVMSLTEPLAHLMKWVADTLPHLLILEIQVTRERASFLHPAASDTVPRLRHFKVEFIDWIRVDELIPCFQGLAMYPVTQLDLSKLRVRCCRGRPEYTTDVRLFLESFSQQKRLQTLIMDWTEVRDHHVALYQCLESLPQLQHLAGSFRDCRGLLSAPCCAKFTQLNMEFLNECEDLPQPFPFVQVINLTFLEPMSNRESQQRIKNWIDRPLPYLQQMKLFGVLWSSDWTQWIPNIQHLVLQCAIPLSADLVERSIPLLIHLRNLYLEVDEDFSRFHFVCSLPQLMHLTIDRVSLNCPMDPFHSKCISAKALEPLVTHPALLQVELGRVLCSCCAKVAPPSYLKWKVEFSQTPHGAYYS
jgi:hypothetical protein